MLGSVLLFMVTELLSLFFSPTTSFTTEIFNIESAYLYQLIYLDSLEKGGTRQQHGSSSD